MAGEGQGAWGEKCALHHGGMERTWRPLKRRNIYSSLKEGLFGRSDGEGGREAGGLGWKVGPRSERMCVGGENGARQGGWGGNSALKHGGMA
jgi:hypothetical protein